MSGGSSVLNDYIAGAVGGCAGLIVGHPFDTTKVQLQTQAAESKYTGTWDCIKNVHKHGWTKGFFRGMSWPVLSYGAVNSVFFGVYGNSLSLIQRYSQHPDDKPRYWEIYLAGCMGGTAQLVLACPVDLIKVVLQSQIPHGTAGLTAVKTSSPVYSGPWVCAVDIVRKHGFMALYKGKISMAYRDLPSFGLYTTTYEIVYRALKNKTWVDRHGVLASLVAGGLAGVATWLPVIPFDVAKSRIQADIHSVQYKGMVDCMVQSVKNEGVAALFRGGFLICIRAFLVNAITFLFYSQTQNYLTKSNGEIP